MVIASLNLMHCARSSAGDIGALLAEHRVAIACLQEVDLKMRRSGGVDQPAVIAARAGLEHYRFTSTQARGVGRLGAQRSRYGILTLSALPIVDAFDIPLPNVSGQEPRAAQLVRIELGAPMATAPTPRTITVVNTHLAVGGLIAREQRDHLFEHLAQYAASHPHEPLVVAGDFNGVDLPAGWREADSAPTYPAEHPQTRIDHLAHFVSPGRPEALSDWETYAYADLTDHCLLTAHLTV